MAGAPTLVVLRIANRGAVDSGEITLMLLWLGGLIMALAFRRLHLALLGGMFAAFWSFWGVLAAWI